VANNLNSPRVCLRVGSKQRSIQSPEIWFPKYEATADLNLSKSSGSGQASCNGSPQEGSVTRFSPFDSRIVGKQEATVEESNSTIHVECRPLTEAAYLSAYGASPGFPVEVGCVVELHAAFLTESRTRNPVWCCVTGNPGRPVFFIPGTLVRTLTPALGTASSYHQSNLLSSG
jgi:hypothetical protein